MLQGIIDSTLREGAQTVGLSFSLAQKTAIARGLAEIGVEEIELGIATPYDPELPRLLAACRTLKRPPALALWSRCRKEDIAHAARLAPDVLSLSIPVSDIHITEKLGKKREWVRQQVREAVRFALSCGIAKISLGLEDASRADHNFLVSVAAIAAQNGAHRLRLADTVGIATPTRIMEMVQSIRHLGTEIGVHCHNDFGMATANAITALQHGAQWADTTILGLGERAGNARLEEVAGFLSLQAGRSYQTDKIVALCREVSQMADKSIDPQQPLLGSQIFACETGLHLQGLSKNPATYEPYEPQRVGASRRLIHGEKIGRRSLAALLTRLGVSASRERLGAIFPAFKKKSRELGRPLLDHELLNLYSGS